MQRIRKVHECLSANGRKYRLAHKEELSVKAKQKRNDPAFLGIEATRCRAWKLARFGLTPHSYATMLAEQGGRCKLCEKKKTETLHVDHNHDNRVVRGLLCLHCNTGLEHHDDKLRSAHCATRRCHGGKLAIRSLRLRARELFPELQGLGFSAFCY
jgi:hypothetical protein